MFICKSWLFQIYECHCKHSTENYIGKFGVRIDEICFSLELSEIFLIHPKFALHSVKLIVSEWMGIKLIKDQKEYISVGIDEKL